MSGTQQIKEIHAALRGPSSEPGKPFIADLRAEAVLPGMARAGVVHADPGRCLQPRTQNILGFGDQRLVVLIQQANQLPL